MKNSYYIFKKEFLSYINSVALYVFLMVFSLTTSWLFFKTFFLYGFADMRGFFNLFPWVFLFVLPAITMGLWAEEKRSGTIELLLTLPVSDYEVIIGKFLAAISIVVISFVMTIPVAYYVNKLGADDLGPIIGGYIGGILLAAVYISIGMFISSLTQNQIIAYILTVVVCFIFLIAGEPLVLFTVPKSIVPIVEYLSFTSHFEHIGRGVLDSRDIVYFFSLIILFLTFNSAVLETRKWGKIRR